MNTNAVVAYIRQSSRLEDSLWKRNKSVLHATVAGKDTVLEESSAEPKHQEHVVIDVSIKGQQNFQRRATSQAPIKRKTESTIIVCACGRSLVLGAKREESNRR